MDFKNLNDNKITIQTGISNGLIGKGRKRGSISQENISKILYTYPELNANWLLTGKGDMLKTESNSKPNTTKNDEMMTLLRDNNALLKEKVIVLEEKIARLQNPEKKLYTDYSIVAEGPTELEKLPSKHSKE